MCVDCDGCRRMCVFVCVCRADGAAACARRWVWARCPNKLLVLKDMEVPAGWKSRKRSVIGRESGGKLIKNEIKVLIGDTCNGHISDFEPGGVICIQQAVADKWRWGRRCAGSRCAHAVFPPH